MKKFFALLLALLLLAGSTATAENYVRHACTWYDAFDTVITLTCYVQSEAEFDAAASAVSARLMRLNDIFDRYNPHEGISGLYALNAAQGEWLRVEPELYQLIQETLAYGEIDGGRVNIALGGALEIWHEAREEGTALPDMEALQSAAAHADLTRIELDAETGSVRLSDPEMTLDLGAVAKGWAVEQLAGLLDTLCPDYLIDAGGNIRAGLREHDEKDKWVIGITNPEDVSALLMTVSMTSLSAVTSGGYQRYYEVDGVRYHHLIDPDTLMPAGYNLQTTVFTRDSGLADFLSTATFLMPYEDGRAMIDGLEGAECIWVLPDGSIEMTDGARALCN